MPAGQAYCSGRRLLHSACCSSLAGSSSARYQGRAGTAGCTAGSSQKWRPPSGASSTQSHLQGGVRQGMVQIGHCIQAVRALPALAGPHCQSASPLAHSPSTWSSRLPAHLVR